MNKPRKTVKIGNSHLLDLEALAPDRPSRLLAFGHLAAGSAPSSVAEQAEPLTAITHLVVGVSGDIDQMMAAVGEIKEKNPQLKVILADSQETPYFPFQRWNQGNRPAAVDKIIHLPRDMAEASRSLLHHQAGILTGQGGGLACCGAFLLADKIEIEATVAFTLTNFNMDLLDQLQQ